ncbi:hypothetical protein D1647_20620 [Alistipes sp. Z76]|nr:hypothetical protein [Alistipes sp. Z76]NCE70567.1 hypothetical protein [Muribaculaceae bacterium M3]
MSIGSYFAKLYIISRVAKNDRMLFADGGGQNEPCELQSAAVGRRRTARLEESQYLRAAISLRPSGATFRRSAALLYRPQRLDGKK